MGSQELTEPLTRKISTFLNCLITCRKVTFYQIKQALKSYEFEMFCNTNSVSHCVCDEAFKSCLKMDGSKKSEMVGKFYFDTLAPPCFTLKKAKKCSKRTWWGQCTESETEEIRGEWQSIPNY